MLNFYFSISFPRKSQGNKNSFKYILNVLHRVSTSGYVVAAYKTTTFYFVISARKYKMIMWILGNNFPLNRVSSAQYFMRSIIKQFREICKFAALTLLNNISLLKKHVVSYSETFQRNLIYFVVSCTFCEKVNIRHCLISSSVVNNKVSRSRLSRITITSYRKNYDRS